MLEGVLLCAGAAAFVYVAYLLASIAYRVVRPFLWTKDLRELAGGAQGKWAGAWEKRWKDGDNFHSGYRSR